MSQNITFQGAGVTTTGASAQQRPEPATARADVNGQQELPMLHSTRGAFTSNAQLSGVDMSALEGISPVQLAAIARLIQAGALQIPPVSSVQTHASIASTDAYSSVGSEQAMLQNQHEDLDKEDGELDDGENTNTPKEQGFLRPPPTGPKKSSRSTYSSHGQPRSQRDRQQSTKSPAHSRKIPDVDLSNVTDTFSRDRPSVGSRASLLSSSNLNTETKASRHAASLDFIMQLFEAGYSFDQLAREVTNRRLLRNMFKENGLSVPDDDHVPLIDENLYSGVSTGVDRKVPSTKRPAPKTALPQDRSEYLAKLQAAKKKKSETSVSAAVSEPVLSDTTSPLPTVASHLPAKEVQISDRPTPVRKINTELIRQRLEALKAQKAARKTAQSASDTQFALSAVNLEATSTPTIPSDDYKDVIGQSLAPAEIIPPVTLPKDHATLPDSALRLGHSAEVVSDHNTGMLPGLIVPSSSAKTVPRKRGVASDFYDDVTPISTSGMHKRPFGRSQNQKTNESLIITVSEDDDDEEEEDDQDDGDDDDDDDEGDEMDIDSSSDEGSSSKEQKSTSQNSKSGDVFFEHSLLQSTFSSAPGTPFTRAPASALERTEQEILNMKKRLAAAERRKAANNPYLKSATVSQHHPSNGNLEHWRRRLQVLQQARLPSASPPTKPSSFQSSTELILPPGKEISGKDTSNADNSTHNGGEVTPQEMSSSLDSSEDGVSMQDEDGTIEVSEATNKNSGTSQMVQIQPGFEELRLSSQVSGHVAELDIQALSDPMTGTNSEDDDDLDDVYGESNTAPPAGRSFTSAHVSLQNAVKDTDIDMKSTDDSSIEDNDDDDDLYEPISVSVISQDNIRSHNISHAPEEDEDRADSSPGSKPQTSIARQVSTSSARKLHESAEKLEKSKGSLLAYESPLNKFKDYRYHPEFLKSVMGGFKSLTYSHQIDPDKPLCPFEADGGKCNDKKCEFQHFGEMAITDNDLLKAIGTEHVPAKTPEDENKWKAGLAVVVRQLRSTNVGQDVQAIARRIAEYRREFVSDPTRTLYLD